MMCKIIISNLGIVNSQVKAAAI